MWSDKLWVSVKLVTLTAGALLLSACGGGASSLKPAALLDDGASAGSASLEDARHGFALTVSPDSFLDEEPAGDFTVDTARDGDALMASISVADARSLRALYCELAYDAAMYTPLGVEHLSLHAGGGAGASAEDMLTLSVLDRPGVVHVGQVLSHWQERDGITGAGELARVRFAPRPFAAEAMPAPRAVSSALASSAVGPQLELSLTHKRLRWDYYYPGDYNQDGLVGVSDLTPLGAHLDERGDSLGQWYDEELEQYVPLGYAFPPESLLWVIDGSGDGFITVSDITQIGQHFDEGVESFRLYESAVPSRDMPQANGEPSTILPLATIPFSTAQGMAGQERIWFNLPLLSARDGFSYWLRPLKDEAEGTPSNPVRNDAGLAESFWLDVQPETYLGGGTLAEAKLEFTDGPDSLAVDLWLDQIAGIDYFDAELHYEHSQHSFDRAFFCSDGLGVEPARETRAGQAVQPQESGQLLIFQRILSGFAGSGYLTRLHFTRGPETEFSEYALAQGYIWRDPGMRVAYDQQTHVLNWYYFSSGDYNQDGSVFIDDLLPVGWHYGDLSDGYPGPFDPTRIEFLVDGTQEGIITLSDTVVIGQNMGDSIDGYFIYMGADSEAEPGPAPLGYVSLAEAEGDPFTERLRFSFHVESPQPGQYLWVRPEFRGEVGEIPEGGVVPVL